MNFTSSASSIYLCCDKCIELTYQQVLRLSIEFLGYVLAFNKREYELWKLHLNSPFCAISADSKSRFPHGRQACISAVFRHPANTALPCSQQYSRRGCFQRAFPSPTYCKYLRFFETQVSKYGASLRIGSFFRLRRLLLGRFSIYNMTSIHATWRTSVWRGHDYRSIDMVSPLGAHEVTNALLASQKRDLALDESLTQSYLISSALDDFLVPAWWRNTWRSEVALCLLCLPIVFASKRSALLRSNKLFSAACSDTTTSCWMNGPGNLCEKGAARRWVSEREKPSPPLPFPSLRSSPLPSLPLPSTTLPSLPLPIEDWLFLVRRCCHSPRLRWAETPPWRARGRPRPSG